MLDKMYFGLFSSPLLTKNLEIKVHNTIILPTTLFGKKNRLMVLGSRY
jgi:hypothetical protein